MNNLGDTPSYSSLFYNFKNTGLFINNEQQLTDAFLKQLKTGDQINSLAK